MFGIAKFLFSYAYGTPGKQQQEREKRESLICLGIRPWERRTDMDDITDRLLAEKAAEDKLRALEAAKPPVVIDVKAVNETDLEALERVEPPPNDDPSAFR